MGDWQEDLITDYVKLERERVRLEQARAEDQEIQNVELTRQKVEDALRTLEQPYSDKLLSITQGIGKIQEAFVEGWGLTDKTYECEAGTATLRTTKALKIVDKKKLISVLLNIGKLQEAVRSWNLSYLRKLKDVGLIEDNEAYFEEHQNVVIKEGGIA